MQTMSFLRSQSCNTCASDTALPASLPKRAVTFFRAASTGPPEKRETGFRPPYAEMAMPCFLQ